MSYKNGMNTPSALKTTVQKVTIRRSAAEIAHQQPSVNGVDNRLTVAQVEEAPKLHYKSYTMKRQWKKRQWKTAVFITTAV